MTTASWGEPTEGGGDFSRRLQPYRRELLAYCYRMMGGIHDAEDLLQETMLRAWRALDDYDPSRASIRTWLYRIATNACLTALEQRGRRAMPSGLRPASTEPAEALDRQPGVSWLQPAPDSLLLSDDPADTVVTRESVRLALVATLQQLPPRQRVVFILRDVLVWRAAEVAELLDSSVAAVNSALQRARAQLGSVEPDTTDATDPLSPQLQDLLARYVKAFETADIAELVSIMRADVALEMPPYATWFAGRDAVAGFFSEVVFATGGRRTLPTLANGQPAIASYKQLPDGRFGAHSIHLLTPTSGAILRLRVFMEPGLFATFDLPELLPAVGSG
ncbi:sigma-70 family RNA polymerase sigma factor [Nakamurella lactea]|uniref:sigma-70 family RNA polymerase sigma factor n=1 Tax=Nakamurella lactea TaxID=459515 RepID=UPI00041CC7A1|nr:sigma-70 family RNA polymerase sigma factor [Nakamurella lactea]